jgi:hypothetical protein
MVSELLPATIPPMGFAGLLGIHLPLTARVGTFSCRSYVSPRFNRCRKRFGTLAFLYGNNRRFDELCVGRYTKPSTQKRCLAEENLLVTGNGTWISKNLDRVHRWPIRFRITPQCSHRLTTDQDSCRSSRTSMKCRMESQTEIDAVPLSSEDEEQTIPEVEVSHYRCFVRYIILIDVCGLLL